MHNYIISYICGSKRTRMPSVYVKGHLVKNLLSGHTLIHSCWLWVTLASYKSRLNTRLFFSGFLSYFLTTNVPGPSAPAPLKSRPYSTIQMHLLLLLLLFLFFLDPGTSFPGCETLSKVYIVIVIIIINWLIWITKMVGKYMSVVVTLFHSMCWCWRRCRWNSVWSLVSLLLSKCSRPSHCKGMYCLHLMYEKLNMKTTKVP